LRRREGPENAAVPAVVPARPLLGPAGSDVLQVVGGPLVFSAGPPGSPVCDMRADGRPCDDPVRTTSRLNMGSSEAPAFIITTPLHGCRVQFKLRGYVFEGG
jgi:hypothetical protein